MRQHVTQGTFRQLLGTVSAGRPRGAVVGGPCGNEPLPRCGFFLLYSIELTMQVHEPDGSLIANEMEQTGVS